MSRKRKQRIVAQKWKNMVLNMYTVRDVKADIYHKPFYEHTHGSAERAFKTAVNDPQGAIYGSPEDYQLFFIGSFDDRDGSLMTHTPPTHIVNASQLVEKKDR